MRVIDDARFGELYGARQPGRGPDRRQAPEGASKQYSRLRPNRPPGGHAGFGSDRRLQDQSATAAHADEVPPAYVEQLALYRAVFANYTPKAVRAALIWTESLNSWSFPPPPWTGLGADQARAIAP